VIRAGAPRRRRQRVALPALLASALGALALGAPGPPRAQGMAPADIFTADYSTADGNWTVGAAELCKTDCPKKHIDSLAVGGGPGGRNALLHHQVPNVVLPFNCGQYDFGRSVTIPDFGTGVSRFVRLRLLVTAGSNMKGQNGAAGRPGPPRCEEGVYSQAKFLMMGTRPRVIVNLERTRSGALYLETIWDGIPPVNAGGSRHTFSKGQWVSIQGEIRYGEKGTAYQKWWINTDTYARPSFAMTGESVVDPHNGQSWRVGTFMNHGLAADGVFDFYTADYRIASTFDPAWHASLGAGAGRSGGRPPQIVHGSHGGR
jgi:hypothetical protein